jgi:hypothetical protein
VADPTITKRLQAAYDKVALYPEKRGADGLMDLLALRNLVPLAVANLAALEAERDEARALASRRWEERRAALDVMTTDGLSASEWMLRTGLAERRSAALEEALREADEVLTEQGWHTDRGLLFRVRAALASGTTGEGAGRCPFCGHGNGNGASLRGEPAYTCDGCGRIATAREWGLSCAER